jgi:hypothetical protein
MSDKDYLRPMMHARDYSRIELSRAGLLGMGDATPLQIYCRSGRCITQGLAGHV